ncbi:MAG: imelysin family protein [Candidatus Thiodiazotropha sp. L084R]
MNRFKALLISYPLVLIGLALSTSLYGYEFESLANEHILVGYQKLLETTNNLNHSVNKLCKKADTSSLNNSRSHYREAFSAWQSIQHIRFGPIQYLSREYRFEFKRVFDLVMRFRTSKSPKRTRSSTTYKCPGRPGH